MAFLRDIQFGDGKVVTITDWGDYPIWSRARILPAQAADISLFQYQVGAAGPGIAAATDSDTNIPSPGQLPAMHEFLIYSVQILFDEIVDVLTSGFAATTNISERNVNVAMHKMKTFIANTLFQFRIEQSKNFIEGRIDHFPSGGGPHFEHTEATSIRDSNSATGSSWFTNYIQTNGIQSWEATRRLASPIYLAGLETFRGVIRFPRGAWNIAGPAQQQWVYGLGVTCRLTGPRRRPAL